VLEIFAIPLHAHPVLISSTSQVFCVIIIVTLQLLWLFSPAFSITGCYAEIPQPLWQLILFIFSVTVKLTFSVSVIDLNPIQLSITLTNIFISLEDSQWLFTFSVNHPMCLQVLWLEPSVVSGSYTMSCYSSPLISFRFICVVG
jgi:hypothetical protein